MHVPIDQIPSYARILETHLASLGHKLTFQGDRGGRSQSKLPRMLQSAQLIDL